MIIGLVGFAGSGKGTVADILVDSYDYCKLSFADAVKDATSTIFGWSRNLLEGDTEESRVFREKKDEFWSSKFGYDVTPRHMLQLMGTEAGREVFHQDLWVHTLERRISYKRDWEFEVNFVIPDVRFPNEIESIRNMGGFIIRIRRGEEPSWYETAYKQNVNKLMMMHVLFPEIHHSEWAWIGSGFDYEIVNDGSMTILQNDVRHMLKVFTGPNNQDIIEKVA